MRILLLSSSYNSLTQHAHVGLTAIGHEVCVELAISDNQLREGVELYDPDLIVCPMLTHIIPKDVAERYHCLIVHPGIKGDRGASSLDWAILNQEERWGVTVVEAKDPVDSGPIWSTYSFPMRAASKSSLYRDEVTTAAMKAIYTSVRRFENGFIPAPLDYSRPDARGRFRPPMKQAQRAIDWCVEPVDAIMRRIRASDGSPGVLDTILGDEYFLFGAHEEGFLIGDPGQIIAQREGAICRAAVDGAVWISHLKRRAGPNDADKPLKLPAAMVLGEKLADVPTVAIDGAYGVRPGRWAAPRTRSYCDIWYEEQDDVGHLHFRFYNGAMSTRDCERLLAALEYAKRRPTRALVLFGGRDYFSNGIHLNTIEAAADPAEESWRNINAIDDVCLAILTTTDKLTIAALHGSAGAGGVMMAIAADRVIARDEVVLNPHYKSMGGLYGSEYWTYTLPRRVGQDRALELTEGCLPISARRAKTLGLIDAVLYQDESGPRIFNEQVNRMAEQLAHGEAYDGLLDAKQRRREHDERVKPLAAYRADELERMRENFFGNDRAYHIARSSFVRKAKPTSTQPHLALHRARTSPRQRIG